MTLRASKMTLLIFLSREYMFVGIFENFFHVNNVSTHADKCTLRFYNCLLYRLISVVDAVIYTWFRRRSLNICVVIIFENQSNWSISKNAK